MSSIYTITKLASKYRKRNGWNFIIPILFFVVPFIVGVTDPFITREMIKDFLQLLLSLNGSILGLTIAGFSVSNVIPKELMAFMASTKAEGWPYSNFKVVLLNYVFCFVALFSAIFAFTVCYIITLFPIESSLLLGYGNFLKAVYFAVICSTQGWVLVELKVFLFWIFDNSLMLGQLVAEDEGKTSVD